MSAGFKAKSAVVVDAGAGKTVPWPTGHHTGDYAILVDMAWDSAPLAAPALPAGCTLITSVQNNTMGGVKLTMTAWYIVATSGLMANITVATEGSGSAAQMFTFSGALNAAPDVSSTSTPTTSSISIAGVTTTTANDLVVDLGFRLSNSGTEDLASFVNATLANDLGYTRESFTVGGNAFGFGLAAGMMRAAGATGATTATFTSGSTFLASCAMKIALKPKATVSVTQDATSLKWWGSTEDEWSTLFHGDGFATPIINYNCQDPSTTVADSIGVFPMAIAAGTPQFAQTVASWSRKAIVCRQNVTDLINTGGFSDGSNLALGWLNYPTTNGIGASMSGITFGNGFGNQIAVDTQPTVTKIDLVTHGDTHTNISTPPGGLGASTQGVHLTFLQGDKDAATATIQTDLETLTHATTAADNWGAFALGGNNVQYWQAAGIGALSLAIFGGFATTSTIRATITDRLNNGPAVTSITIAPGTATIAPLATQAMVATSTRADGSTFVNTGSCAWVSASPSIATVNASTGVVTGVSAGTAVITCTFASLNAATITSNGATITVTGGVSTPTIKKTTISAASPIIIAGQTKQEAVVVTYSDNSTADITTTAKWSTGSASIASVTTKGLLTGVSAGTTPVMATAGVIAYPNTAAAMAAAVGYGTWSAGWLCDETSGSLVPAFGSPSLTAVSSPVYNQPGPLGAGDYAIQFDSTADQFLGGAGDFDVSGTDDLAIAWVGQWTAKPTAFGALVSKVSGSFGQGYALSGTDGTNFGFFAGAGSTFGSTIGANYLVGQWHIGMAVIDRGAGTVRMCVRSLDGQTVFTGPANAISGSLSVGSAFALGNNAWTFANLGFSMAALYMAKGSGVAATMSANLTTAVANLGLTLMGSTLVTTAPYLSSIDHIAAALSRLPAQFQKTKIQNLIRAFTYPAQELEQALWAVLTQRSIKNAIGAQLDVIGGIVGQARNGMNDDDYRRYISARVAAERSQGTLEDLYGIATLIVNDTTITFEGRKEPPATLRFTVKGGITDQLAAVLYVFLHIAVGAGIRLVLEWSNVPLVSTFRLDVGPGLDVGRLASSIG